MTDETTVATPEPPKVKKSTKPKTKKKVAAKKAAPKKAAKKKKPVKKAAKKATKKPNGRPLMYPDKTIIRMPKGFLKRVNASLKVGEAQGDFMRSAVEMQLRARRK